MMAGQNLTDAARQEWLEWLDKFIDVSTANPYAAQRLPKTLLKRNLPKLYREFRKQKFMAALSPEEQQAIWIKGHKKKARIESTIGLAFLGLWFLVVVVWGLMALWRAVFPHAM